MTNTSWQQAYTSPTDKPTGVTVGTGDDLNNYPHATSYDYAGSGNLTVIKDGEQIAIYAPGAWRFAVVHEAKPEDVAATLTIDGAVFSGRFSGSFDPKRDAS